ncbi:MAG: prolipoprotein diacylglyceryl transferase [Pelagibacteraceae bacterium]|jgi:phosphatidylglycerol---prolipoprotein diacylglyceryl transferase|nr:prolipoprotein diacylglyceryl transferase [Pelagibacteraceae bacterium]
MYIHDLNPVLINFGFFEVRWYSLAYIFGILIGWWAAKKIINFKIQNKIIEFDNKIFDDLISYIIISIIVGGRLGYVIFYNLSYYLSNPFDIFKIWQGGMSFHGALIGIMLGTYIFANKLKVNTFFFLDIIACVAPIGIFFGRIANFINGELYGKPTNVLWSVIFPEIDKLPRHPSQLYEAALEGIVLFFILISQIYKKSIKTGTVSALFMILYGFFRIVSEIFREPDIQVGYLFNLLSMGSVLSFVMILIGLFILKRAKDNEFA